jgi:hypothetical protein
VIARAGPPPKEKPPSAVAALYSGEGITAGVPPPGPQARPVQLAQARP